MNLTLPLDYNKFSIIKNSCCHNYDYKHFYNAHDQQLLHWLDARGMHMDKNTYKTDTPGGHTTSHN